MLECYIGLPARYLNIYVLVLPSHSYLCVCSSDQYVAATKETGSRIVNWIENHSIVILIAVAITVAIGIGET